MFIYNQLNNLNYIDSTTICVNSFVKSEEAAWAKNWGLQWFNGKIKILQKFSINEGYGPLAMKNLRTWLQLKLHK